MATEWGGWFAYFAGPCLLSTCFSLISCAAWHEDKQAPLEVLVASSMQDVFRELEKEFESRHPGAEVALTAAGSQILRLQIEEGGIGDLFVSANRAHMDALVRGQRVGDVQPLARGKLALVISSAMRDQVKTFSDLTRVGRLVVGTAAVPIGAYTQELWKRSAAAYGEEFAQAIREKIVSRESNVRLVRAKVLLGEADAAIVYESDARAAEQLYRIEIPPHINVETTHWLASLRTAVPHPQQAAFLQFLRSPTGRQLLTQHGFVVEE